MSKNLHKKLLGEVPDVYRDPVSAAIIGAAVIGVGSSVYQAKQQEKAAEEDAARRQTAADEEQARLDKIAAETRPDEQALAETQFGVNNRDFGSTQDFLVPKTTTSALGGTKGGRSGLGFAV